MKYSICYAADNNYAQHVAVSLVSLYHNNTHINNLEVYVLSNNLSNVNISNINIVAEKFGRKVRFIPIDNIKELIGIEVSINQLSISTYSRLFLTVFLPKSIEIVLYLDCDVIINGNIEDIWNVDITNDYVAGAIDTMYPSYFKDIGLSIEKKYINAGVLLINLAKWRKENICTKFIEFIEKFKGNVPHLDQGVINGVFPEKQILELKYNVQTPLFLFRKYKDMIEFFQMNNYYSEREWKDSIKNPKIIHYSSFFAERPWFRFCLHPMKKKYLYYKNLTPYREVRLLKNKISLKQKIKDILMIYFQPLFLRIRRL